MPWDRVVLPTKEVELKSALKTNKVDCSALLANYQCGQNEVISVPSGDIIQVKTGDEIAINSIAFEVVELDGSGNGSGIVKVPMFNNAKFGVEFKGIKVAKGGCVVTGEAELSHVDFALLSEKQREKLAEVYKAFNLALTIADSLAPQIAKGINDLNDKLFEKKQNTKKLLAQTNIENLTEVLTNCMDISSQAKTLQDSLEKAICLVKAGKLKAKQSTLEQASKDNIDFMNKLGPALANCQNKPKWEDWTQKPCSGHCMPVWDENNWVDLKCKKELEGAFGVGDKSKLYDARNVFNMTYKDFLSPKYVTENESKLTNTCIGTLPLGILEQLGISEDEIKNFYPPKDKKPISSIFQNDVDLYRFVYLSQIANVCAKDYLPEVKITEYYVDKKYLEVIEATRYMLAATESAAGLEGEEFQEARAKLFTRLFEENNSRIDEDIKLISREESRNTLATILSVGQILLPATAVDNAIGVIAGKLISRLGRLPSKGFKYLSKGARLILEKVLPKTPIPSPGLLVGKYDWALVKRYFQHIQDITGRSVGPKQIERLKAALKAKEYKLLSKSELDANRLEFNSKRNQIIKDWERETGQSWPEYTQVILDKNGKVYKKIGDKYDGHHIIENKFGGENEWWNMHPAKSPDEHQGGIHGSGSPANELFK